MDLGGSAGASEGRARQVVDVVVGGGGHGDGVRAQGDVAAVGAEGEGGAEGKEAARPATG